MAVVYRAEDIILGRTVALKTLHERYAEMPSFRQRFRQEARAMACLDHENIVKVYDISEDGQAPFIVAECVAGKDIGKLLGAHHDGRLNEKFARRVATQLLRALSYAHRRGVIHRDVKPSNILVTASGTVKVADFGIARIVEDDEAEVGRPGEIVGSARYMSPEQLMGKEATPRSDVYSVGVLLYHCLTGRPPFSGDVRALAQKHIHEDPAPPRRLNKKISPHMEAVILKALAKDPKYRYPSAIAMLEDIDLGTPPRAAKTAEVPRSKGGRRGLVLAATLILLVALAGGGALASGLGPANLQLLDRTGEKSALSRAETIEAREPPPAPEASREPAPEKTPSHDSAEESSAGASSAKASASTSAEAPARRHLVRVPDVRAFYDYFAEETLASMGFRVKFVYDYQEGYASRGVTWATDPAIGTKVPRGSVITVYATPEDYPQPQL